MHKKTKQRFVWLGLFSILAWFVTTFALIAFFFINGAPPLWITPTVPSLVYDHLVLSLDKLIFAIVPALTSGYLFIGLFIFKYVEWSKRDQD